MSANILEHKTAFLYYFKMIGHSFAYLNSAVNPLIYAFLNRSFRNNCGNILSKPTCAFCCQKYYYGRQDRIAKQKNDICQSSKGQNIIIDNHIPSTPHEILDDDFSDAEYEAPNADCFSQMMNESTDHDNNSHWKKQTKPINIKMKKFSDSPLTTSL